MKNTWLEKLQPGDTVLEPARYGRDFRIGKVARLTATQIVVVFSSRDCEYKYRRSDGRSIGRGTYSTAWLVEPTPEKAEAAMVSNLKAKAVSMRDKLVIPDDRPTLEALIAALEPFVAKKPPES